MRKFRTKFLIIIIFFCIMNFNGVKSYAKYIINHNETIIKIENADSESPVINGRNYNVDYEIFNKNVIINYEDNIKVKSAKYWINSENKEFLRRWKCF